MVTVVDRKPDPSVVKQVVCKGCGCKLEYVPVDIQQDYDSDYTGSKDYYKYIKCPECGLQVRL
jgi:hypothetical protein